MPDEGPFKLSHVLAEELEVIRGPIDPDAYASNADLLPAERPGLDAEETEEANRRSCYCWAHQSELSALCLSGGGIRSAAISLGVIQALADAKLLGKFDYLSTVSGGGYIGCWLSAWLYHANDSKTVLDQLGSKRASSDAEPPPLAHLRNYSNYLTPRVGLFSADTWTAVAIVMRNIVVNWLILLPALALLVIAVKLLAMAVTVPLNPQGLSGSPEGRSVIGLIALLCPIAGGLAFGYKLGRLYMPAYSAMSPEEKVSAAAFEAANQAQGRFLWWSLLPAVLAAFFFVWLAHLHKTPVLGLAEAIFRPATIQAFEAALTNLSPTVIGPGLGRFLAILAFALPLYILAILIGGAWRFWLGIRVFPDSNHPFGLSGRDFFCWLGGVLVFAFLVWLGVSAIRSMNPSIVLYGRICEVASTFPAAALNCTPAITVQRESLVVVFGVPWFLMATMFAHSVYLLLRSHSVKGEVEREWLGRASGWHFIAVIAWIVLSAVVLLGPAIYYNIPQTIRALTLVSGTVTGLLGKSGLTSATGKSSDWKGFAANAGLAVAGPLFAVLLLILLSVMIDWSIVGWDGKCFPTSVAWKGDCYTWRWLLPIIAAGLVLWLADYCANINSFALHAIYRNRLIRCFLGGACDPKRHPDGFTDFDWDDDLRVAELWRTPPASGQWRPIHVINMTLNLAETNRLAWQQRKAMPFSVTPHFSGNPNLRYRPTRFYGGPPVADGPNGEIRSGISLGTAMAISGAAVSSNMGYHSSMSLSFLLTFFNVRLGVWLGNTRGDWDWERNPPYMQPGPRYAVGSLLSELFGLTTDERRYVYLSDGGHFENLGLYEMVRRRCKWIVLVDGDQDGKRGFADLGNAVRKIWIDLGIRITFDESPLLSATSDTKSIEIPYFAVGTIDYLSDPSVGGEAPRGTLLYIKPVVRGDEAAADVVAYKKANDAFPDQSTVNQWFNESQFEAYRRLGQLMTEKIVHVTKTNDQMPRSFSAFFEGLQNIDQAKMSRREPQPINADPFWWV